MNELTKKLLERVGYNGDESLINIASWLTEQTKKDLSVCFDGEEKGFVYEITMYNEEDEPFCLYNSAEGDYIFNDIEEAFWCGINMLALNLRVGDTEFKRLCLLEPTSEIHFG